jgi:predicted Zn-dependent peptidase
MLSEGLINTAFGKEYFTGRGFAATMFMGESNNPKKVKKEILSEIERIRKDGIRDEDFEVSLKKLYGAEVFVYNDVDDLANNLIDAYFNNHGLFDTIELYKEITKEDVEKAIDRCNELLKNNICKTAVILIDKDLFEEHPNVKYENIEFLPVSNDLDVEAIKTLII